MPPGSRALSPADSRLSLGACQGTRGPRGKSRLLVCAPAASGSGRAVVRAFVRMPPPPHCAGARGGGRAGWPPRGFALVDGNGLSEVPREVRVDAAQQRELVPVEVTCHIKMASLHNDK